MDAEEPTVPPREGGGRPGGGEEAFTCLCCSPSWVPSMAWRLSLKRKLDERDAEARCLSCAGVGVARVETESEAMALREALVNHQQSVQKLQAELEEERSAAASAATEAMLMILRLQHEKAEAQMEARQFKRLAEGKMAHDQHEIAALEDLLYKRDQTVQSLSYEVRTYRHRLLSYGIGIDGGVPSSEPQTPDTDTATAACSVPQFDLLHHGYPPSRCNGDDAANLDKYHSGPEVIKGEGFSATMDCASNSGGRHDMSDEVYTVAAVHGASEEYVSTPRELRNRRDMAGRVEEAEIRKLYTRLQALDADRESMTQTLISLGTDMAQMVLLKQIAQQMYKEVAPERKIVKKPLSFKGSSLISTIKSVISFFWRKKSARVKYTFGLSPTNVGLLLLLDKSSRMRQLRSLTRTQRSSTSIAPPRPWR
ncbi:myosin-binding protein 7-like [Musa acuminata AAA Group]|uniref:myosin-binding protein 7-like n=1 Tax=Musa acuminata AAA Group TaxID=214697 RepID=UPI0031D99B0A